MSLTGRGALTAQDIKVLWTGYMSAIHDCGYLIDKTNSADAQQQPQEAQQRAPPCLVVDMGKLREVAEEVNNTASASGENYHDSTNDMSRIHGRLLYYYLTDIKHPVLHLYGFVLLTMAPTKASPVLDYAGLIWPLLQDVFPIPVQRVVVAQPYEPYKSDALLEYGRVSTMLMLQHGMVNHRSLQSNQDNSLTPKRIGSIDISPCLHGNSVRGTLEQLINTLRISRNYMPTVFGGNQCLDKMFQECCTVHAQQDNQIFDMIDPTQEMCITSLSFLLRRQQRNRPFPLTAGAASTNNGVVAFAPLPNHAAAAAARQNSLNDRKRTTASSPSSASVSSSSAKSSNNTCGTSKAFRKQQSKPKKRRKKSPIIESYEEFQRRKKAEMEQDVVVRLEGESDAAFTKRRNAIYSRRLYERRNQQVSTLQSTIDVKRRENYMLRTESQRLQVLMNFAQQQIIANGGVSLQLSPS